ncbi:NlpC/P60 family protein [Cytobacillus depressus]|uniref:NlpC/P60 family protein n=1 Tax=Cytobacillus depressus TaxID=1602942 RepID=A0A6L3UZQ3_9BACI|nr:NlpC/P60 family protein [Cytobacillus depressus]KAB2329994.1 NlpC/P60 family protein [Cytobacillus depressus]
MNKRLVTTTLALTIGLSTFATAPIMMDPVTVSAATITQQSQNVVEKKADDIINLAKSLIGKATYASKYNDETLQFRCASFIAYIFERNGLDLGNRDEAYMVHQGTYVPRNQLQKGDLVFFRNNPSSKNPNHVGLYIGENKIIHMANTELDVVISDLDSTSYYRDNYMTARRVIPALLPSNPATKGDNIAELSYNLMNKVTMGNTNNEKAMQFTSTGFVKYVYGKNGADLKGNYVKDLMNLGEKVARKDLQKGDLIFFSTSVGSSTPSRVAIYTGEHRILVLSSEGISSRVLLSDYYDQRYITAKRVFKDENKIVQPPVISKTEDKIVDYTLSIMNNVKHQLNVYDEKSLTFTNAGFTYYIFKQHGVDLKTKVAKQQSEKGVQVPKDKLQKGDLIFLKQSGGSTIKYAAIYIGNNEYVYLSDSGSVVKESLESNWSKSNFVTAKRVL